MNSTPHSGVQRLHSGRIAGRAQFAGMLREHIKAAARSGQTLVPAWAARWGVSENTVRGWYDETEHTGVVGAGDLNALESLDLIALLERWLETTRAALSPPKPGDDPRFMALECATRAGSIARKATEAMADNKCDAGEWATLEAEFEKGEADMRNAKLAARAARAALNGGA